MSRQIPPLNPLRVFESVARLRNLTKAALELHVTQSAVSRQIASIETWLGVKLLQREARGISLTAAGEDYYKDVNRAFVLIASATRRTVTAVHGGPLRVRVYSTFAAQWLMHRLPRFHEQCPNIDVSLDDSLAPVDFERDDLDLSIEYCRGERQMARRVLLFGDLVEPVCSPSLQNSSTPLRTLDDLRNHKLFFSRYRRSDWADWLKAVGRTDLRSEGATVFPSSLLAYRAAIAGMGVAMGHIYLLERELESGLLIRPFNHPVRRKDAYYVLLPVDRPETTGVRAFVAWLQSEVAAMLETKPSLSQ